MTQNLLMTSLSLSLSLCFFMLQQSYHIAHSSSHAIIMKLCMHPGVCGQSVHMHIYVYVHSFFFFLFFCDFGTGVNSCDQQTVIGKLHSLLSFHVDFVMIKSRHKIRHYIRHFEVGDWSCQVRATSFQSSFTVHSPNNQNVWNSTVSNWSFLFPFSPSSYHVSVFHFHLRSICL